MSLLTPDGATTADGRQRVPDLAAAERAAAALLTALGARVGAPDLADTPRRMAQAYAELLTPPRFEPTVFDGDAYDGVVVVGDIAFHSLCAHHGLPFMGRVDIGYIPTGSILGLSKLAWAVQLHSRRLQIQERLTQQLADWLIEQIAPKAVMVRVRAEHLCMSLRGVRARGAITTTLTERGDLANDPLIRQQWANQLGTAI